MVDIGKLVFFIISELGCRLVGMGRAGVSVRFWCLVSFFRWSESFGNLEVFWILGFWRDFEVLGGFLVFFFVRFVGILVIF